MKSISHKINKSLQPKYRKQKEIGYRNPNPYWKVMPCGRSFPDGSFLDNTFLEPLMSSMQEFGPYSTTGSRGKIVPIFYPKIMMLGWSWIRILNDGFSITKLDSDLRSEGDMGHSYVGSLRCNQMEWSYHLHPYHPWSWMDNLVPSTPISYFLVFYVGPWHNFKHLRVLWLHLQVI